MKREIVCEKCGRDWVRISKQVETDPEAQAMGERVKIVRGRIRERRNALRCDCCNVPLGTGDAAAAVSVYSRRIPYFAWEGEFLHAAVAVLLACLGACTVQLDLPDGGLLPEQPALDLPGAVRAFAELQPDAAGAPAPPPVAIAPDAGTSPREAGPALDPPYAPRAACPGPTVCRPSPDGLGHREFACVDPAGYRFISESCAWSCPDLEYHGQLWPQECVRGALDDGDEDAGVTLGGCAPICEVP